MTTNYSAITHPSLPNYLALIGGAAFGITNDCNTRYINAPNLAADWIAPSGRTWKAYMESMPSPCYVGDSGDYRQKHDPFIYFNDVRTTSQCQNVVPMTKLAGDLASTSTTPDFGWITPNMCDDMHNCSISTGDTWLKNTVPMILNSPAFTTQNSLLVITWDENDYSPNNIIPTLFIGKGVVPGLAPPTANDASAPLLSALFTGTTSSAAPAPTPTVAPTVAPTTTAGTASTTAASAGIKVVRETNATAASAKAVTVSIPATTAGGTLAVMATLGTGNSHWAGAITDSAGTSWDPAKHVASAVSGSNGRAEIWWREGVPGGLTSLTVSLPAGQSSIGSWAIKVVELSGAAKAAALDSSAMQGNNPTTTVRTGRATAARAGELPWARWRPTGRACRWRARAGGRWRT